MKDPEVPKIAKVYRLREATAVETLRDLLARAESGEIGAIALVTISPDASESRYLCEVGNDPLALLGAIEVMRLRLAAQIERASAEEV